MGPDGGFTFRHALIRDAVLRTLLPPERVDLARRALHAVRTSHSELSGAWCALAADLAVQSDDPAAAADLLLELGRRDLARGALTSAETTLRRGRALARTPPAPADTVLALDELLSEVLVQAGRPDDAVAITTALLDGLIRTQAPPHRRALTHLRMARAWTVAGRWDAAATQADLTTDTDPSTAPAVALIRAHIAIGRRHFDHAEHLARKVRDHPDCARSPDLTCEAFEILGRLARRTSLTTAKRYFTRVVQTAEQHNLPVWRARGLHELSTIDLFSSLRTDHARQASEDAAAAGASALTAVADYHLGSIHCWGSCGQGR